MKKNIFIAFTVLIFSIFLVSCNTNNQANSKSNTLETLTIGVMPDLDSIPFIIAQQKGFFEEENITVNIEHFKSAQDRDSALQTGNLDGAISDMLAVVFFNDNDFDIKITSKTDGSFKLIAGENTNIEAINDIKGNTIGISSNTIIEYLTDRLLAEKDIKKTSIPQIPTRLEMLSNGTIDMATLPEPLASVALLSGGKILDSSDNLGINPGVMIFTNESIETKTEEIKAFYKAYNKAIEYLSTTNKEDYIDIIIKEAGFPETVKDTLIIPNYTEASPASEEEFNAVLQWLKSKDLTSNFYKLEEVSNYTLIE